MKIAYIFDQPLPGKEADQMQLINTIAALSRHGCEVTLFLPASNVDDLPTADALREYYKIDAPFKLDCIHSIFHALPKKSSIRFCVRHCCEKSSAHSTSSIRAIFPLLSRV